MTRVEYEIEGPDGLHEPAVAFDLRATLLPVSSSGQAERTLTLYQLYGSVNPPAPDPGHSNARFAYYMITNSDGREPDGVRELDPADRRHAWRTAEADSTGARRYPDGEYRVTVTAYDSRGNSSRRGETVLVQN